MSKTKQKLQDFVDSVVIPAMENNKSNWDCIFKRGCFPQNAITQRGYKGINWLMLNYTHKQKEYTKPLFATYKQWASVKAQVNKGSKGTMVVFYKPLFKTSKVDPSKEVQAGCVLSYSTVFNIDQVNLTNSSFKEVETEFKTGKQYSIDAIEKFVKSTQVAIQHRDGLGCFYAPSKDLINMELKTNFKDTIEADATVHYYSTLFHELTHSTMHEKRLNRKNKFDDSKKSYAYEELIAELGSVLFSNHFNITKQMPANHAKYLNSWIKCLKNDFSFLTGAIAQAQKAFDLFVSSK